MLGPLEGDRGLSVHSLHLIALCMWCIQTRKAIQGTPTSYGFKRHDCSPAEVQKTHVFSITEKGHINFTQHGHNRAPDERGSAAHGNRLFLGCPSDSCRATLSVTSPHLTSPHLTPWGGGCGGLWGSDRGRQQKDGGLQGAGGGGADPGEGMRGSRKQVGSRGWVFVSKSTWPPVRDKAIDTCSLAAFLLAHGTAPFLNCLSCTVGTQSGRQMLHTMASRCLQSREDHKSRFKPIVFVTGRGGTQENGHCTIDVICLQMQNNVPTSGNQVV